MCFVHLRRDEGTARRTNPLNPREQSNPPIVFWFSDSYASYDFFQDWPLPLSLLSFQIRQRELSPSISPLDLSVLHDSCCSSYPASQAILFGGFGVRSGLPSEILIRPCSFQHDNGGLGFLRGYVSSIGAGKVYEERNHLWDLNFLLANRAFLRSFSSDSQNKKSEIWHY